MSSNLRVPSSIIYSFSLQSNCKTKTEADAKFQVVSEKRGNRYEVVGTNLCLQKLGRSRKIALKQCKRNMSLQQFQRSRSDDKFDLRPIRARGRCLTNHHHPKAGEVWHVLILPLCNNFCFCACLSHISFTTFSFYTANKVGLCRELPKSTSH